MSFDAGAITGKITLNTASFDTALSGINEKLRSFTRRAAGLGSIVSAALGGIGVGEALKLSANMEQTQIAFGTMLGSMEKGKKVVQDMFQYSAKTPFQFTGLIQATRLLTVYTNSGTQAEKMTKAISNVAAGSQERLMSLAQAYGEVASQGHLMGYQVRMMAMAGFNPLNVIAKKTGQSMTELKAKMEKGQIGIDQVTQAFVWATSKGGQYYQMNKKESRTLAGVFSTLKDNVQMALIQIGDSITKNFNLKNAVTGITDDLKRITPAIVGFIGRIGRVAGSIGHWVKANSKLVMSAAVVAGAVAGVTAGVYALDAAIAILTSPIALVVAGIAAISTAMAAAIGKGDTMTQKLTSGFKTMATWIIKAGVGAFTAVEVAITHWRTTGKLAFTSIKLWAVEFWNDTKHLFTVAIPGVFKWFGQNWLNILKDMGGMVKTYLSNAYDNFTIAFKGIWHFVSGIDWKGVWHSFESSVVSAYKWYVKTSVRALHKVWSWIKNFSWSGAWKGLKDGLSGALDGATAKWKNSAKLKFHLNPLEGFHFTHTKALPDLLSRKMTSQESKLKLQMGDLAKKLSTAFDAKFNPRVAAILSALGLGTESAKAVKKKASPPAASSVDGAGGSGGSGGTASNSAKPKLPGLYRAGSAIEQRLEYMQSRGSKAHSDVQHKQLDEQKKTVEWLGKVVDAIEKDFQSPLVSLAALMGGG